MPKTRKKAKKTKDKKSKIDSAPVSEQLDSDTDEQNFSNQEAAEGEESIDISSADDESLKAQLQSELQRLQDEYKRQKQITADLEHEHEAAQTLARETISPISSSSADTTNSTTPSPLVSETAPQATELPDYPEIFSPEPGFDSDFLGTPAVNKQFMDTVTNIESELGSLKAQIANKLDRESLGDIERLEQMNRKLENTIEQFSKQVKAFQKDVERTDLKLGNVLLDLGFEESLEINKIPHKILVLVYETILNDIVTRIKHGKGTQDTEEAVNDILEDVRSHTSGGELFKYEHNKIRILELQTYLRKKLISPKQIHITYTSILEKLLDYVPGYQPKNFKAMIKMQSQEYAVSNVIKLDERVEELVTQMATLEKSLNKFMSKFKDNTGDQQSFENQLEMINNLMSQFSSSIDELPKIIDERLEAILEQKLNEKLSGVQSEDTKKTPEITPKPSIPPEPTPLATAEETGTGEPSPDIQELGSVTLGADEEDVPEPSLGEDLKLLEDEAETETSIESEVQEPEDEIVKKEELVSDTDTQPPINGVFKSITLGEDESEDQDVTLPSDVTEQEPKSIDDTVTDEIKTEDEVEAETKPDIEPTEESDVHEEVKDDAEEIEQDEEKKALEEEKTDDKKKKGRKEKKKGKKSKSDKE